MAANVGGIDKIVRIVAGAGLIGATVAGMLPVWGYIGIVPLATGLLNWCPAYTLFGMNTCGTKK
ncbi:MAG TPA: DUF2892 domain-containing protein [Azonexus sp.]|nr:DUF2892 domain-containing protein [Azonexus sp.]